MAERVQNQTEEWIKSVPVPQATNTYVPISNTELINTLQSNLEDIGLYPVKKRYTTSNHGMEVFGDWQLSREGDPLLLKEKYDAGDMHFGVSFVNSYDKKLKLEIIPGVRICICSNQAMSKSGVATFDKKHIGNVGVEFPIFIQNSLEQLDVLYTNFQEAFNKLRGVSINKKVMAELAGRMYVQEDIITSEQMSLLKKEINKSTFSQFDGDNGFNFYQHCTYAARNSHPSEMIDRYVNIHEFVTESLLQ